MGYLSEACQCQCHNVSKEGHKADPLVHWQPGGVHDPTFCQLSTSLSESIGSALIHVGSLSLCFGYLVNLNSETREAPSGTHYNWHWQAASTTNNIGEELPFQVAFIS